MFIEIANDLGRHGLIPRGGFAFGAGDDVPAGPCGAPASAVLLVGHAGGAPWPHFERWRARRPGVADPLDAWSGEIIGAVAARFGARAVFPSDRPYLPFQQWAMRAEGLLPSPLGILMHPVYGLWHAYRGALLFERADAARALDLQLAPPEAQLHLCDLCPGKPCLKSCPVYAHSDAGFAYASCLDHVRSPAGEGCAGGCRDRNACPHGAAYRYPARQQAFHMAAFAG